MSASLLLEVDDSQAVLGSKTCGGNGFGLFGGIGILARTGASSNREGHGLFAIAGPYRPRRYDFNRYFSE